MIRALASTQCGLGSSLLSVFALLRGFFSGFSKFPPSTKNKDRGTASKLAKADVASSINI